MIKVINTIIKICNLLVLALLVTMYFTDPEQGGMLGAVILFFTIGYDVYYWIAYSIVKRFVEKEKNRSWWLLFLALFPFAAITIIAILLLLIIHFSSK